MVDGAIASKATLKKDWFRFPRFTRWSNECISEYSTVPKPQPHACYSSQLHSALAEKTGEIIINGLDEG